MVIRALDVVPQCYSAADGFAVSRAIRNALATDADVRLSFDGVFDVPSSFVNAAIVSLLDTYPEEWIKSRLTITDATLQIADMVRRCLNNGIKRKQEGSAAA